MKKDISFKTLIQWGNNFLFHNFYRMENHKDNKFHSDKLLDRQILKGSSYQLDISGMMSRLIKLSQDYMCRQGITQGRMWSCLDNNDLQDIDIHRMKRFQCYCNSNQLDSLDNQLPLSFLYQDYKKKQDKQLAFIEPHSSALQDKHIRCCCILDRKIQPSNLNIQIYSQRLLLKLLFQQGILWDMQNQLSNSYLEGTIY